MRRRRADPARGRRPATERRRVRRRSGQRSDPKRQEPEQAGRPSIFRGRPGAEWPGTPGLSHRSRITTRFEREIQEFAAVPSIPEVALLDGAAQHSVLGESRPIWPPCAGSAPTGHARSRSGSRPTRTCTSPRWATRSSSRARNVEREVGLRQIYLKFEGDNPTGTQKDRIAFAQAMDALRRGFDAMTVATCGNYGVAVALAASLAGLRCIVYVPEQLPHAPHRGDEQPRRRGAARVPATTRASWRCRASEPRREEIYDANPGGANTALQLQAYGEIAYEIYDELRDAPAVVAVPVSNGTTLAGIHKGFVSLYRRGKTSRIPEMVAGSSFGKNPIVQAFRKNDLRCENLKPDKIRETAVNEPLVNWSSIDGDHALAGHPRLAGWASFVSDKNMLRFSRIIREQQGLSVTAGRDGRPDRSAGQPPGERPAQRPLRGHSHGKEVMTRVSGRQRHRLLRGGVRHAERQDRPRAGAPNAPLPSALRRRFPACREGRGRGARRQALAGSRFWESLGASRRGGRERGRTRRPTW